MVSREYVLRCLENKSSGELQYTTVCKMYKNIMKPLGGNEGDYVNENIYVTYWGSCMLRNF